MWTKPAVSGVQVLGALVLVFGVLVAVGGYGGRALFFSFLFIAGGLGLIVLGGVKIRQRLKQDAFREKAEKEGVK